MMKATFQTLTGEHISSARSYTYSTKERAIRIAIQKGYTTLQSTDERGRVLNLTHHLENRLSTSKAI